jgi:hypothetical protein
MRKKILLYSFIFYNAFFCLSFCNSENILKSAGETLVLGNWSVLESEYLDNNQFYLSQPIKNPEFIEYDGGPLPHNKKLLRRIYTLHSDFYLDDSLKEKNLGLYIGPFDYPCDFYLNGKKIFTRPI